MNRRQRRAAEKQLGTVKEQKATPVLANNKIIVDQLGSETMHQLVRAQVQQVITNEVNKANNDTMSLISSIFIIVLKEFYEFDTQNIKDVLASVFEQLELCGNELVTVDEMMSLCKGYGIETFVDEKELEVLGKKIFEKQKVYDLLDKGITEIEDLHKATGINSKAVSAYRWEYNTKKYGGIEMSKKDEAFELFNKGIESVKAVAKEIGAKEASVQRYKTMWNQEKGTKKEKDDMDRLADAIFGDDDAQDEPVEALSDTNKQVDSKIVESNTEQIKNVCDEEQKTKMTLSIPGAKKGLKITRKTEIEGDFGNYIIENRVVDCHIACANMGFEKQQLLEFIEELQIVAGEMS